MLKSAVILFFFQYSEMSQNSSPWYSHTHRDSERFYSAPLTNINVSQHVCLCFIAMWV